MTHRVYVVGTDTGVGKTALTCALLQWARREAAINARPFKPAQSGCVDPTSDASRLAAAAGLGPDAIPKLCPFNYDEPIAPGLADDPAPFFRPRAANTSPQDSLLEQTAVALEAWEADADLVLLEGAGGLHVPMPGGTWQPAWIERLADAVIVVGRAHLGTINHTLLTLDAVQSLSVPVLGFYLVVTDDRDDPSEADNPAVIASARATPHLGTLRYLDRPDGPGPNDLLSPLLAALGAGRGTGSG